MSDCPSSRERVLFDELIELPERERELRLRECCGNDMGLRARLEQLLRVADHAERDVGFLGDDHLQRLDAGETDVAAFTPLPRPFGHFRLVSVLGAGGMGLVYEAEQDHPKRFVALKVMRSDLVSRDLVRRFRRETDTLARLQHPGIAHVYEAGSVADTALGGALVPYIAMELVRGATLDDHVRRSAADMRRIVSLLIAVCDAVQHAHERGVVHRDLKPANILVVAGEANHPQPKILDFGIARLVESDSHRRAPTLATSTGQILGTLAYMSPEQMDGRTSAIDARTDVYALGVMLFELLTGRLPLNVRELPIADAARIVRDEEPTRLGAVDTRLRGDLETIVSKAIEKDPDQRYPSAATLAADLRRFLADEPIHARPTTRIERARRFARRHRGVVWGVTATIAALSMGLVVAVAFAYSADTARRKAEWASYRVGIAAANAALVNFDVRSARQHLDATPETYRGWEWRHLMGRLDQSVARIPADLEHLLPPPQAEANLSIWTVVAASGATFPPEWPAICTVSPIRGSQDDPSLVGAGIRVTNASRSAELWCADSAQPPRLILRRSDAEGRWLPGEILPLDGVEFAEDAFIEAVALSPDARSLAAVVTRPDGRGVCWSLGVGSGRAATIAVHRDRQMTVGLAISDRGEVGISAGPDETPIVWQPQTGAVARLGNERGVRTMAFSHDGTRVATGSQGGLVAMFSIDGTPLATERRHLEGVQSVRFSPSGNMLVTASQEGTIGLWAVQSDPPDVTLIAMLVGHVEEVQGADFSADGRWIVSASYDRSVRVWPTNRSGLFGDVKASLGAFGQIDFAAKGGIVAAASFMSISRLWDATERPPLLLAESPAWSDHEHISGALACSPDGSAIVTIESDSLARIRTRVGATLEETWRSPQAMCEVGYTIDGQALGLAVGSEPPHGRLRQLPANTPVELPLPACASPGMTSTRDGSLLVVREMIDQRHHVLHVLDAHTGATRSSIPYGVGCATSVGELPDGRSVVAVAELEEGGTPDLIRDVIVRDLRTGEPIARLKGHAAQVFGLAFTPDGSRLVTGGRDAVLRIWDTKTWDEIVGFSGPGGYLWALRFSPSGDLLVSGGGNATYRFWRAAEPD